MNIGIDITAIIYNRGVSRYTSNLVRALIESDQDVVLFGSSFRQKKTLVRFAKTLESFYHRVIPTDFQSWPPSIQTLLWHTLKKSTFSERTQNVSVFHSWDWLQPPDKTIPLVSTIHDLAILKFPENAHPKIVAQHQKAWEILKERKARLIAVSATTKKDIIDLLGYPGYLIDVVHEALPKEVREVGQTMTEERAASIKESLSLTKPYLLFVGTREPRKNLLRLIEAWKPLQSQIELLIAGESGWDTTENVQEVGLRFLGQVSDEELSVLYAEAELFAYPSLYEGFGLPILEAFHHGTPVVTSNNSGMIEVAGNAAELVDPLDVSSITKAIEKILSESNDDQKKRLQRMIIRQQMFSWKKVARETLAVYKKAIADYA
ncbi:MAG: glycosyltransferase family 4 protein [Candidatus Pacebacteria bacterium]|nr:glycosyltransferase family 4 protein [Candidatus Paceibacterota bacterium]PIR63817.1 MAG: hypothetical protein COU64_02500 [Candidatus Pacebacteria bacterium CG10_big_fil_rev_8_21_14_0_10_40_26]PIZ78788.1 MAG: hypothetical protein COY01_03250 [Candidatus Pacebacteria bacterium CG_4_10_14_0_2_um_filter_40_20]PJA68771.1 MAG: hypothetical protein CO156_03505 [Candidatus Pacebacteria bacterium CG_4_9_14_3_um_filter_40_12]PJC41148.1 MAG: hypothetical protein CO041_05990 [Candidatus Pacebacteria b